MATYIGTATSRIDGKAKVTGEAKYAGEFNVPGLVHGYVVDSTIRLVGTTLMWEQDGYTVRIEGAADLEAAKRIAGSMELR